MADTQALTGFVTALLGQGVTIPQIESALARAENLRIGNLIVQHTMDPSPPVLSESSRALSDYGFATAARLKGLLS